MSHETSTAMNSEHRLQASLIAALKDAVATGRDADAAVGIFDRLLEFTKVHFASEEMLMRLYAYDGFDAHVQEHEDAMERLSAVRDRCHAGDTALTLEAVESLGRFIAAHIGQADRSFGAYLDGLGTAQG